MRSNIFGLKVPIDAEVPNLPVLPAYFESGSVRLANKINGKKETKLLYWKKRRFLITFPRGTLTNNPSVNCQSLIVEKRLSSNRNTTFAAD